jgi:hypothetical protein
VCSAKRAFRAGSDGDGVGDRAARVEQGHLVAGPKGERLAALDRPGHPLAVGVRHVGDAAYGDALPRLNLDGLVDRDPRPSVASPPVAAGVVAAGSRAAAPSPRLPRPTTGQEG